MACFLMTAETPRSGRTHRGASRIPRQRKDSGLFDLRHSAMQRFAVS